MKNLIVLFFILTINISYAQIDNEIALEAFFDKLIQTEVDSNNIAGATISIVKDGKVKFQKGYGYADIDKGVKVDGKNTVFRIGSVCKLFVWIAIMKLYEEGQLDLADDITKYLPDLAIPNNYPQKITIKHLMSHSAGFEEEYGNLSKSMPDEIYKLGTVLKNQIPAQVRPPGSYASYSNHGANIAAHIVENITKMNFMAYVEEKILLPLGMGQSTYQQPIPLHLEPLLAKGYKKVNGTLVEQSFDFIPLYASGAAGASGGDMAIFMQMLLNHGRIDDVVVLDSSTYDIMTSISHQHHPLVNPMRHGFMDLSQNGLSIYGHGGDIFNYSSILALIPEKDIGIFFSTTIGTSITNLRDKILPSFLDEYFPEKVEQLAPSSIEVLAPFSGTYALNRYAHDDIGKIMKLGGMIEVEVTEDGYLKTAIWEEEYKWAQQDDLIFRHRESSQNLVFERGAHGKIIHAFIGEIPVFALDRVTGIDKPLFHGVVLGLSFFTFLSTMIYWLFNSVFNNRKNEKKQPLESFPRTTKYLTLITLAGVFSFYIGFTILFYEPLKLGYGMPAYTYLIFSTPLFIIGLTSVLFYHLVKIWTNSNKLAIWKKGAFSCICLCLVLSIFQWNYWNLIGFNF